MCISLGFAGGLRSQYNGHTACSPIHRRLILPVHWDTQAKAPRFSDLVQNYTSVDKLDSSLGGHSAEPVEKGSTWCAGNTNSVYVLAGNAIL